MVVSAGGVCARPRAFFCAPLRLHLLKPLGAQAQAMGVALFRRVHESGENAPAGGRQPADIVGLGGGVPAYAPCAAPLVSLATGC